MDISLESRLQVRADLRREPSVPVAAETCAEKKNIVHALNPVLVPDAKRAACREQLRGLEPDNGQTNINGKHRLADTTKACRAT